MSRMPEGYNPGAQWTLPRQQFLALYKRVGTWDEAVRLAPRLVTVPCHDDGTPYPMPPERYLRQWIDKYDCGEEDIPPKVERIMGERLTAMRMSGLWRTLQTAGDSLEVVAKKSADGQLEQKVQSQLLSLGNAFNYGMASLASMEKQVNGSGQPQINITGKLSLNAGPAPKKKRRVSVMRVLKAGAPAVVEGEYREVPLDAGAG